MPAEYPLDWSKAKPNPYASRLVGTVAIVQLNPLGFALDYTAEVVEYSPVGIRPGREFAADPGRRVPSWGHVRFSPRDAPAWTAGFEMGGPDIQLYGMPSPDRVLVTSGTNSYVVSAVRPDTWYRPRAVPVRGVMRVEGMPLVVLWDFVSVVGLGPAGEVWKTGPIGQDEVQIREAGFEGIRGASWHGSAPGDGIVPFVIDPMTGRLVAG